MKRRKFIEDSTLIALSVGVFGKIKWNGQSYVGVDPTTTDILGPFYRPGAPFKTDLVQAGTKGEIMHFSGTVFGKDGKVLKGALVEIWHLMRMAFMITLRMIMFIVLLLKPVLMENIISKVSILC